MPEIANLLSGLRSPGKRRGLLVTLPLATLVVVGALLVWMRNTRGEADWPVADHPSVMTITVGLSREPDTLFPLTAQMPEAWLILNAVLEPPLQVVTYTYQPGVLTQVPTLENQAAQIIGRAPKSGIEQDTRQVTMTFAFSPNLRWADGTSVTADDSVFAFELARNPDMEVIWPNRVAAVKSYDASSPYSVTLALQPGYFDPLYFSYVWTPLPRHILGNQSPDEVAFGDYARTPMGYGPYTVREWVRGEYIMLQRNPYYHRHAAGRPRVPFIVFKFIPDPDQQLQMLIDGEIDVALGLGLEQMPALLEASELGQVRAHFVPGQVWEQLAFNLDDPLLADQAVRQAIALGTNRSAMVQALEYGLVPPMQSWIVPQHPLAVDDEAGADQAYDPDGARERLEAAGWKTTANGLRAKKGQSLLLTIRAASDDPLRSGYLDMFQQDMAAIGISTTIELLPRNYWYGTVHGLILRDFQVSAFPWLSGPDPGGRELWSSTQVPTVTNKWQGNNYTGWSNPANDAIWETLTTTLTMADRQQLYADQQALFLQDLPALPLFQHVVVYAVDPRLTGLSPNPTDTLTWNIADWDIPLE